jgi:catechol 2,3-dioxygenase-like lactoylglutathione lyase family enzyme
MLSKFMVVPTLPVTNLERAKQFYGEVLGLKLSDVLGAGHVLFKAGRGTSLVIYERPTPTKADNTAASFMVDNIDASMKELRKKGVVFEEYDFPGLKTVNGIATLENEKSAWFKDPDGNILAVSQLIEDRD